MEKFYLIQLSNKFVASSSLLDRHKTMETFIISKVIHYTQITSRMTLCIMHYLIILEISKYYFLMTLTIRLLQYNEKVIH